MMRKFLLLMLTALIILSACRAQDEEPIDEHQDIDEVEDTENDEAEEPEEPETVDDEETTQDDEAQTDEDIDDTVTDEPEDPPVDESGSSESGGSYSPDDAILLVEDFLQTDGLNMEMNYLYDGDDDQGNYRIQVFEVVDHGEGDSHTATYGWYLVNPETGEVTDLFD